MTIGEHPAEAFEAGVKTAQHRATLAMLALGATVLVRLYNIPVRLWQSSLVSDLHSGATPDLAAIGRSDSLAQTGALAELGVLLFTGVLFLRWLHTTVTLTRALGGDTLRFTPRDAVLGFIIPFLNIQRPYQVVRDVPDHLAPDAVPEPPVTVTADASMGYREVAMVAPPPPIKLPHASIGAWWGFFWIGNILSNVAARQHGNTVESLLLGNTVNNLADAVDVVGASLGVVMVRGLTARLVERYRRVRHNSPEALRDAGVEVGAAL